jgi:hypothetical protein
MTENRLNINNAFNGIRRVFERKLTKYDTDEPDNIEDRVFKKYVVSISLISLYVLLVGGILYKISRKKKKHNIYLIYYFMITIHTYLFIFLYAYKPFFTGKNKNRNNNIKYVIFVYLFLISCPVITRILKKGKNRKAPIISSLVLFYFVSLIFIVFFFVSLFTNLFIQIPYIGFIFDVMKLPETGQELILRHIIIHLTIICLFISIGSLVLEYFQTSKSINMVSILCSKEITETPISIDNKCQTSILNEILFTPLYLSFIIMFIHVCFEERLPWLETPNK